MAVIAGGIDQARPAGRPRPGCCRSTGRRAGSAGGGAAGSRSREPRRQPLDPLAPGPVEQARGRDQPLLAPESAASRGSRDCRASTVPTIIDRPAIALARCARAAARSAAPMSAQALGLNTPSFGDMFEQQHAVMLALDQRAPARPPPASARSIAASAAIAGPPLATDRRRLRRAAPAALRKDRRRRAAPAAPRRRRSARRRAAKKRVTPPGNIGNRARPRRARARSSAAPSAARAAPARSDRRRRAASPCRRRTAPAPPRSRPG